MICTIHFHFSIFDYIEKPGCDAIRLQFYSSYTSGVDLVVKTDSAEDITMAAIFRFNKWNYDLQLPGGFYNSKDYVSGTGWSGNI